MSEPNNEHLADQTLPLEAATKIPFKTFPADRISDDKDVEDRIRVAVAAERARHEYRIHVLDKIWGIARDGRDLDYDTNNLYDLIREGVAAKNGLEEGKRQIVEFVASRTEEALVRFDITLAAVDTAVERCATIAEEATNRMREIHNLITTDESWRFAMDEMSAGVNEKFRIMQAIPYSIATLIRSGE